MLSQSHSAIALRTVSARGGVSAAFYGTLEQCLRRARRLMSRRTRARFYIIDRESAPAFRFVYPGKPLVRRW